MFLVLEEAEGRGWCQRRIGVCRGLGNSPQNPTCRIPCMGVDGDQVFPASLFCDSSSSLSWLNESNGKGSRYVDIRYHGTRDLIADQFVTPVYMAGTDIPADLLTKVLGARETRDFARFLKVY